MATIINVDTTTSRLELTASKLCWEEGCHAWSPSLCESS